MMAVVEEEEIDSLFYIKEDWPPLLNFVLQVNLVQFCVEEFLFTFRKYT